MDNLTLLKVMMFVEQNFPHGLPEASLAAYALVVNEPDNQTYLDTFENALQAETGIALRANITWRRLSLFESKARTEAAALQTTSSSDLPLATPEQLAAVGRIVVQHIFQDEKLQRLFVLHNMSNIDKSLDHSPMLLSRAGRMLGLSVLDHMTMNIVDKIDQHIDDLVQAAQALVEAQSGTSFSLQGGHLSSEGMPGYQPTIRAYVTQQLQLGNLAEIILLDVISGDCLDQWLSRFAEDDITENVNIPLQSAGGEINIPFPKVQNVHIVAPDGRIITLQVPKELASLDGTTLSWDLFQDRSAFARFPTEETHLPAPTPEQFAEIGQRYVARMLTDPAYRAAMQNYGVDAEDDYDPEYEGDTQDSAETRIAYEAYADWIVRSNTRLEFEPMYDTNLAFYHYIRKLVESGDVAQVLQIHELLNSDLFNLSMNDAMDNLDVPNHHVKLTHPDGTNIHISLPTGLADTFEKLASSSAGGLVFTPDANAADQTAADIKATETPPAHDLAKAPISAPGGEGYATLDPEILNPKPTGNEAADLESAELPGYEATPYVEKLSENGGALPASTERFANASPREAAERMLSKFVRTHGSIHMIEPSVHTSEFGETVSYWPQVISSSSLPELSFWEAHFGYLSEFPVRLPDGEVEMMDVVELKATLQQFEGANTYFAGTSVVPGVVPMVFSPSFAPLPVASPGFVAPGMGLAPVF